MKTPFAVSLALVAALGGAACRQTPAPEQSAAAGEPAAQRGTIRGHVRLMGKPPENPEIRMHADPMCFKANGEKDSVEETVTARPDGSLADVFVQLQGTFPGTPAPTTPVTLDQRGCIYVPRVVGLQLGQPLRVRNSDPGLHNVHGVSTGADGFNIGQPMAGIENEIHLKDEGIHRLQCDVHGWMIAFVGVVSHPYFAVTSPAGTFEIRDVPVGMHTIKGWHELYGNVTSSVQVEAGGVADVELVYSAQP